jgi:GNAT superfamily N-acetyltransferase
MDNIFNIRTMKRSDVDFAIELAAKEGWNPGLNDADVFYNTDPRGFLIGLYGEIPVGCISVVSYDNKFGFLGFYIVVPEFRDFGFGTQLWNAGLKKLKKRNIGLDGVFSQQDNYSKSGFRLAYSNIRYEWNNTPAEFDSKNLFEAKDIPFEVINGYDKKFFPADRTAFLQNWLVMPNCFTSVHKKRKQIDGYGVIRKCRVGYKIGPLFADDPNIAENIFLNLVSKVESDVPIYIDVPDVNEKGMALAEKYNMTNVFGTARMYRADTPEISIDRTYGVTTFELG